MKVKNLKWSDETEPNNETPYSHVIAETPFGRFVITWKGWKQHDCPTIDETPWNDYGGFGYDLESAKEVAEDEYQKRVLQCLVDDK